MHSQYKILVHMTGYAGSRNFVGNLQSPWTPHRSTHPAGKIGLRSSHCEFCAGVLCTELATRGSESATRGSCFSVGCVDRCGVLHGDYRFPTETRRIPSYEGSRQVPGSKINVWCIVIPVKVENFLQ